MATANPFHERAREAEHKVLNLLHKFGYLTAAQVAALVYPQHAQKLVLARRTLLRLHRRNLVLVHRGEHVYSEQHYALSLAGARAVYQLTGIAAESGKDVIRTPSAHRDAANWSAIRLLRESTIGTRVWTEREIQTGRCPVHAIAGKVPDTLSADEEGYCTWVEVEASRRGGRDMQKLVRWLVHDAFPPMTDTRLISLNPPQDTLYLSEVRFVIADVSAETFPQRLIRALREHGRIADPLSWARDRLEIQTAAALDAPLYTGLMQ